jgi:hypothetical protein
MKANVLENIKENSVDYIDCLDQAIENMKCKDCEAFICGMADRGLCISSTLDKLKEDIRKL